MKKIATYSIAILLTMQSITCFAENYATNSTIRASSLAGELRADFAADGNPDTSWGSGVLPNSWIEFDFGIDKAVTEIKVIVDQKPAGETKHEVYLDDVLSHTWEGPTDTDNELIWAAPEGARANKVRIETISSPSWVGWKEISILGPDEAPAPNPEIQPQNFAVLADNFDITFTLIEFKTAPQSLFYRADLTHIGTNPENEMLWKLKNHQDKANPHGHNPIPTIDEGSNFIRINSISSGKITYWANLEFIGDNGEPGALVWKLKEFGQN